MYFCCCRLFMACFFSLFGDGNRSLSIHLLLLLLLPLPLPLLLLRLLQSMECITTESIPVASEFSNGVKRPPSIPQSTDAVCGSRSVLPSVDGLVVTRLRRCLNPIGAFRFDRI